MALTEENATSPFPAALNRRRNTRAFSSPYA
jgi:hypothetical protein